MSVQFDFVIECAAANVTTSFVVQHSRFSQPVVELVARFIYSGE